MENISKVVIKIDGQRHHLDNCIKYTNVLLCILGLTDTIDINKVNIKNSTVCALFGLDYITGITNYRKFLLEHDIIEQTVAPVVINSGFNRVNNPANKNIPAKYKVNIRRLIRFIYLFQCVAKAKTKNPVISKLINLFGNDVSVLTFLRTYNPVTEMFDISNENFKELFSEDVKIDIEYPTIIDANGEVVYLSPDETNTILMNAKLSEFRGINNERY